MNTISVYQERFGLDGATFSRVEHEDAMVAVVYRVTLPSDTQLILKICTRANDYFREVFFLGAFAGTIRVPRIIQVVPPGDGVDGAILMECLAGSLLKMPDFTDKLAYELGECLARIHFSRQNGYGDLIQPMGLSHDPKVFFTQKFEEGFEECSGHLTKDLLEQSRKFYDTNVHLLESTDGPCIVHRDFRPGNILVHEGKLQGVIDWASARSSFAEEDFCSLEHGEWSLLPEHKASFLTGYASIRPVPEYGTIMPLLQLSKVFATIGYLVKIGTWNTTHARLYQLNRQYLDSLFKTI